MHIITEMAKPRTTHTLSLKWIWPAVSETLVLNETKPTQRSQITDQNLRKEAKRKMCSFGSCQTRFEFISQFRIVQNAFECFVKVDSHYSVWANVCQRFESYQNETKRRWKYVQRKKKFGSHSERLEYSVGERWRALVNVSERMAA